VKQIVTSLMLLFSLAIIILISGCDTQDIFMSEEDRLPRMEAYATYGGTRIVPAVVNYCVYYIVGQEILPCDQSSGVLVFQMYIESYDLNQKFDIEVIFPTDDIEYYQHFDPADRPTVAKWPQQADKIPIAWETVGKTYTSDGGRGPGGYFTVNVAVWAPLGGQYFVWAPKYDDYSFFNRDPDDPDYVEPEITFILTDGGGRKVMRKLPLFINIIEICTACG
jgi:hypothetical protein